MSQYKCPKCDEIIEKLNYSCDTTGREYGDAMIDDDGELCDYESNDSDCGDCDNYEYQCPECNNEISPDDLIEVDEDEEKEDKSGINEDGKKIEPKLQDISQKLISTRENSYWSSDLSENDYVVCKECGEKNILDENEESCACSNCDTILVRIKTKAIAN
jgi:DNA-directed RNA polymerase subunit RPC12/RpoP